MMKYYIDNLYKERGKYMKTVVIYKSKYGTTKRYAQWIAEALQAPLFESSEINPSQLSDYDVVIYGGGLYASGILGVELVVKNHCKSLVVFTVGLSNPDTTDYTKILEENFSQEFLAKIKVFHLRGGIDYKKLGFIYKVMMFLLIKLKVEKIPQEERTREEQTMLDTYGDKVDFTDETTIIPLLDYVRGLNNKQ